MQRYAPQRQWVEWSRCSRARTSLCSRQRRWEQRKHVLAAPKGWLLAARLGVDSDDRLHLPRTKLLARTCKNILTHTSCYTLFLKFTSVHRLCPRMRMSNQHNTKPRVSPALHNRVYQFSRIVEVKLRWRFGVDGPPAARCQNQRRHVAIVRPNSMISISKPSTRARSSSSQAVLAYARYL